MAKEGPKRKRDSAATNGEHGRAAASASAVDTFKPTAVYEPTQGRNYTVTVALPGSIVANAQTHDLKTAICGAVARALAVFCVDEVVVFDDGCSAQYSKPQSAEHEEQDRDSGYTAFLDPGHFMFHVLSYLETPPYLRRALLPYHPNLRSAGSLPSLDIPSHTREHDQVPFREGVTIDPPRGSSHEDTFVNVGTATPIKIIPRPPQPIPPNTRVTLHFDKGIVALRSDKHTTEAEAEAVHPALPREQGGYYWGYTARQAASLSDVFTECPYDGGYDYSIGTSERGRPLSELVDGKIASPLPPDWRHLLVVIGGPPGLEAAAKNDAQLRGVEAAAVFDAWVNLVEGQGSRTIRSEEALWLGLMGLWPLVRARAEVPEHGADGGA